MSVTFYATRSIVTNINISREGIITALDSKRELYSRKINPSLCADIQCTENLITLTLQNGMSVCIENNELLTKRGFNSLVTSILEYTDSDTIDLRKEMCELTDRGFKPTSVHHFQDPGMLAWCLSHKYDSHIEAVYGDNWHLIESRCWYYPDYDVVFNFSSSECRLLPPGAIESSKSGVIKHTFIDGPTGKWMNFNEESK
jgi:hypothetical protein